MEHIPIAGKMPEPQSGSSSATELSSHQKEAIRASLAETAKKLLGIPYEYGAEWLDVARVPEALDCSELTEGVYRIVGLHMPDGGQNQYYATIHSPSPRIGDLAFFGRGGKETQIYHVGMVLDSESIIEARGFDPTASFKTGEVITRPISKWIFYKNFIDFRTLSKLA